MEPVRRGSAAPADGAGVDTIDLRVAAADIDAVAATLDGVAGELRSLWAAALAGHEFAEVHRLAEASHAVHRAVVALRSDDVIASGTSAP